MKCWTEKGISEEITDEQVLFAYVGEVISCNLLPQAIEDVSGEHWLCRGRGLCLVQIVH